jgi:hypothetical protein
MPDNRVHDISTMTASELERARRDLMVSLGLAFPVHRCEDASSRTSAPLTPSSPSGQAPTAGGTAARSLQLGQHEPGLRARQPIEHVF